MMNVSLNPLQQAVEGVKTENISYTLRYSPRARHIRLKITSHAGLEIIVPKRFNEKEIPSILEKHQEWITRTLSSLPLPEEKTLPSVLNLTAISQQWMIHYIEKPMRSIKLLEKGENQLILQGNVHDKALVEKAFKKWLCRHASRYFHVWLDRVSQRSNLAYKSLSIRYTRSRWGSCSTKKNISLSARLLFLKPELVEHIMIHELCHTVHFNHSKQFWKLFESLQENYKDLKKEIRALSIKMSSPL